RFEAYSAFTHVTACLLAGSLNDPLHRRLRQFRYLHYRSDCYWLEQQLPGGTDPTEERRLCTAHRHERLRGRAVAGARTCGCVELGRSAPSEESAPDQPSILALVVTSEALQLGVIREIRWLISRTISHRETMRSVAGLPGGILIEAKG